MALEKTDYQIREQGALWSKILKNKFFLQSEIYFYFLMGAFIISLTLVIMLGATFKNIYAENNSYSNRISMIFIKDKTVLLTNENRFISIEEATDKEIEGEVLDSEVVIKRLDTQIATGIKRLVFVWFVLFMVSFVLIYKIVFKKILEKSQDEMKDRWISGAKILTADEFRELQKEKNIHGIELDKKIYFSEVLETVHGLFLGAAGTGKSVKMKRFYTGLKKRDPKNQRFIVHDVSGEWIEPFYNKDTDYILNPLDVRSINFDVFSLISDKSDIDSVAEALIPAPQGNSDPIWFSSARNIFKAILYSCYEKGMTSNKGIQAHLKMSVPELAKTLKGVAGAEDGYNHIAEGTGQASNLYSNFSVYMDFFKAIDGNSKKEKFDLEEWLESGTGTIFLANYSNIESFVSPILTLFVNSVIRISLAQKTNLDKRTFIFLDEFGKLKKMKSIIDGLTLGRKKGLSIQIGIQEDSNIEEIYGKSLKGTILNNVQTKILLGVTDPSSSKFVSDLIGEVELEITTSSNSLGTDEIKDGTSFTKQRLRKPAVLPSEVGKLNTHEYFYFQRGLEWARIQGTFEQSDIYPDIEERLVMNDTFSMEMFSKKEENPTDDDFTNSKETETKKSDLAVAFLSTEEVLAENDFLSDFVIEEDSPFEK